ncbi:MAG: tRNA lysidine(34) synthetase TilS, partial [Chloroflexi bacterium]|nr:tRNA lysidine(34) synthetase TilS [Chloroflexota bacterium]
MREKIHEILMNKCAIPDHSRLVVAVSGGPDSICLFDLIYRLPYQTTVVHFNHQLRPESDEEMRFVKSIAEGKKIPFFSRSINIHEFASSEGLGIEEAARRARYEFIFHVAAETKSQAVVTAHHADDQVETVLMNFIRGAGLKGLSGMTFCQRTNFSEKILLARPMLDFRKAELLAYCQDNGLQYYVDESNYEPVYFRNRIRNELIPLLREYNPNFIETVLRNQKALADDLRYILEITNSTLNDLLVNEKEGVLTFSIEKFSPLPDALKNYVLKELIQRINPDWTDISFEMIKTARTVLEKSNWTQQRILGKGIYMLIEGGEAALTSNPGLVWQKNWPSIQTEKTILISENEIDVDEKWSLEMTFTSVEKIGEIYLNNPNPLAAYLDIVNH